MFMDAKMQTRFFTSLLSFIFTALSDERMFNRKLMSVALSHCHKGIKAIEYGIVGEVMFWSLKTVLGELYDADCHRAWVKLFSSMLAVIVPVAVSSEMECNRAQKERMVLVKRNHAYSYKTPVQANFKTKSSARSKTADSKSSRRFNFVLSYKIAVDLGAALSSKMPSHKSGSIVKWEKAHKRQGHMMIDGIDCYD
jgi:hypothetical protein